MPAFYSTLKALLPWGLNAIQMNERQEFLLIVFLQQFLHIDSFKGIMSTGFRAEVK